MLYWLVSTLLLAGQPIGDVVYNGQHWSSQQQCEEYLASEDGKKNIAHFQKVIAAMSGRVDIEVQPRCVGKPDDSL